MKIWKSPVTIEELEKWNANTIHESLGIRFLSVGDDFLEASMPVDHRTKQAAGLLHGGASVVLAESLGSIASALVVGPRDKTCVGIEINASHLGSAESGSVIGRVTPIRLGKSLHVWNIEIHKAGTTSEKPKMICHSRLTVMIRDLIPG
ncbi:MAG: hotdog fold thioesterase [Bdellovibrionia bacterium]